MTRSDEIWKPIPTWEGIYEISTHGRVRNILDRPSTYAGKILKGSPNDPYPCVSLADSRLKRKERRQIHLLVLLVFVGPVPHGMEANHKDGNKRNPRLDNLEYVTHLRNMHHAIITGLKPQYWRHPIKLSAEQVAYIREMEGKMSRRELADKFGVQTEHIRRIHKRERRASEGAGSSSEQIEAWRREYYATEPNGEAA